MSERANSDSDQVVASIPPSSSDVEFIQLSERFRRQRQNQAAVRASSAPDRIAKLRNLKRAISAHREELVAAMQEEFRKPRMEVELSEIQLVFTELEHAAHHLPEWMSSSRVPTPLHLLGTRSEIRHEPKGLVLIMAAWNYPFALLFAPLVAAVAAGNCVMMRGSERVPHTCSVAAKIIAECFAPDEVALIQGDLTTARLLLTLPFDHIFFTGTPAVGRQIFAAASRNMTSVTLELGGKSPVIVDETADIPIAAERITWGKFFNGGQTCVAPDYALVHESCVEPFCSAVRNAACRFYGESEEDRKKSPDLCRIIDKKNFERLRSGLEDAIRRGAKFEIGGHWDEAELYISPTVMSQVSVDCELMKEEIFGPVLPIISYNTLHDALSFINAGPKPLALYLFTRDRMRTETILHGTNAGGSVINNVALHLLNPDLPFGGVGVSGIGHYHGRFGFQTFSHQRAVMVQGRFSPAPWFYPPYARLYTGLRGWLRGKTRTLRDG
jgi:aldehyde dehydrogenase (NAD+)